MDSLCDKFFAGTALTGNEHCNIFRGNPPYFLEYFQDTPGFPDNLACSLERHGIFLVLP